MFQICRTCLQQIAGTNYVSLISSSKSVELKSQLALCVPEMITGLITLTEPVICASCVGALQSAYTFKSRCLETEEHICNYMQRKQIGINLSEVVEENNIVLPPDSQDTDELMSFSENNANICVKEEFIPPEEIFEATEIKYDHVGTEDNFQKNDPQQQEITQPKRNVHCKQLQDLLQQRPKQPRTFADRPHKCDKCLFSTGDRKTLTKHKVTHSDERPFACTICGYRTKRKDALTLHMKRHCAVKPNICPQCKYSAVTKQCLRRHIMMVHLELRPYKCNQCHLSFADQGTLTNHMKTHTDAKPYNCKICDFSTKRKYSLSKHIKSHGKGTI